MDDLSEPVVVPYERFLECLRRRRGNVAELRRPEPPTTDADVPPVPEEPPLTSTAWRTP